MVFAVDKEEDLLSFCVGVAVDFVADKGATIAEGFLFNVLLMIAEDGLLRVGRG